MHGVGIGHDESVGRARGLELDAGVDDDAAEGVDGVLQQHAGAHRLQRELVVGAFNAGEGEQILGEAIHAAGVFEDDAEEFERGFRAGVGIFDEGFNVALNGSERRAQLVADVGDELAAGFLRGLNAGDVVEHDQRAAGGQGRGVDLKDAARSKQAGAANAEFAAFERAADAGQQLRIADGVDQRAAGRSCDPAMRCMTALDQRTEPAEVMATTASCMESSMAASSWRLLSSSAKSLPSRSAVWLSAASMAESSSSPAEVKACGQVAVGDAAGEVDHARETGGDAAGDPGGQRNGDGERDEAGPEGFAADAAAACSRPECSTKRRKTNSITSVWKTRRRTKARAAW